MCSGKAAQASRKAKPFDDRQSRPLQGALPPVPPGTDNTDDTDITDTNSEPQKVVFFTGNRADRSRMHFYFAL